jgi:hypothetical protein
MLLVFTGSQLCLLSIIYLLLAFGVATLEIIGFVEYGLIISLGFFIMSLIYKKVGLKKWTN